MTAPLFQAPGILKSRLETTLLLMVGFSCQRGLGAEEERKQTFAECLCFPCQCPLLIFVEGDTVILILQTGTQAIKPISSRAGI